MTQKSSMKPLAFALGAAFATTLSSANVASAADNPFAMTEISGGYIVAAAAEGKCGEGKCGGEKKADTEGKCGGEKKAAAEGKCGGEKKTDTEGKCGGEKKTATEGKCGEGKCGGSK